MGQLTITSPWRLDTRSKGDSHSQGSASGGKLKGVTTCFRQVTKQVRPGCHFHRGGTQFPLPPNDPPPPQPGHIRPREPQGDLPSGAPPPSPSAHQNSRLAPRKASRLRSGLFQLRSSSARQPSHSTGSPSSQVRAAATLPAASSTCGPAPSGPASSPGTPGRSGCSSVAGHPCVACSSGAGLAIFSGVLLAGTGMGTGTGREAGGHARARAPGGERGESSRDNGGTGRGARCAPRGAGGWVPCDVRPGCAGKEGAVKFV